MNNKFSSFFIANKIRTKLLLFIDQEIQSKIKQNKLKDNLRKYHESKLFNHVKTYAYQPNIVFMSTINNFDFSNAKNKQKRKNSKNSCSTFEITPNNNNILSQTGENSVNVCDLNFTKRKKISHYNSICFHEKYYSIKRNIRHSSTFQIYKKPKTDKKYLKDLCSNFKITNKKISYNKVNCKYLINKVSKGNSSPIKKIKRKNENNPCF